MERVQSQEVRPRAGCGAADPAEVGKIPDPPVPSRSKSIELNGQAPELRTFLVECFGQVATRGRADQEPSRSQLGESKRMVAPGKPGQSTQGMFFVGRPVDVHGADGLREPRLPSQMPPLLGVDLPPECEWKRRPGSLTATVLVSTSSRQTVTGGMGIPPFLHPMAVIRSKPIGVDRRAAHALEQMDQVFVLDVFQASHTVAEGHRDPGALARPMKGLGIDQRSKPVVPMREHRQRNLRSRSIDRGLPVRGRHRTTPPRAGRQARRNARGSVPALINSSTSRD